MMFSTRSFQFARRSRPWLLLWLVPYLLLSVASESLHNHALELSGGLSSAPALSASSVGLHQNSGFDLRVAASASGTCASCPSSDAHGTKLQADCLACQWSAQSIGLLALASPAPRPQAAAQVVSRFLFSPRLSPRDISRSRGPPLF